MYHFFPPAVVGFKVRLSPCSAGALPLEPSPQPEVLLLSILHVLTHLILVLKRGGSGAIIHILQHRDVKTLPNSHSW
jgi:hypothetical protein